ncbi:hypothetical protein GOQ27_00570 [Clostridium sp. D2Q-11]|uniref:Sucrose phosphatase-like domain-containing protein n=1 Tax=Anaeromonas frigoriresistens TaxID=2683708 RepID=A0A942Z5W8_9FIRM|nr:HAD family hydrolase [Anaeromonas frigoriresistens]MBS4536932.1 hypothetical protein [Anaeromonas frigoriresistens]
MLFASDLDRTLIYSKKFISQKDERIRLVETKNSKEISYMLKSSVEMLKELSTKLLFVPVTTRSIEQYQRLKILEKEIKPKYAIVCNGGNIFKEGKLDEEWKRLVHSKFDDTCLGLKEIRSEFNKLRLDINIKKVRQVDNLFFYCVLHETNPGSILKELTEWAKKNKWTMVLNGRKLYFIPNHVTKNRAVRYIANKEEAKKIITSGDSLLDYCMANISDIFISPSHGQINSLEDIDKTNVKFTKQSGIFASDEILKLVLREVKQNKVISHNL